MILRSRDQISEYSAVPRAEYIGFPSAEGRWIWEFTTSGDMNIIPSGDESAQRATRDDIHVPTSGKFPYPGRRPMEILYPYHSSSSQTAILTFCRKWFFPAESSTTVKYRYTIFRPLLSRKYLEVILSQFQGQFKEKDFF